MTVVPGGVVAADERVAYLYGPHGGVDAVEVATGRQLWSDPIPQKPLAVADGLLLVEAAGPDGLRLRVREVGAHGPVTATTAPLPLPTWALAGLRQGVSFESAVEYAGGDRVRYQWWAERRWAQGMHPPRERDGAEGQPAAQEESGALWVGLAHGTISKTQASPIRPLHGLVPASWMVEGVSFALAADANRVTLRRTRSDGRALPSIGLTIAAGTEARLSVDGRLLALLTPGAAAARTIRLPAATKGLRSPRRCSRMHSRSLARCFSSKSRPARRRPARSGIASCERCRWRVEFSGLIRCMPLRRRLPRQ